LFRVISLNANGIRAAARKGFFEWMAEQNADVVCIQETKAQAHQLTDEIFSPDGYHCIYEDAEKKGYSGTAIYSRHEPKRVIHGYGDAEFDDEGRYLEVQLGGISVVSLYLPSGSSKEERQIAKYRCMDSFTEHLKKLQRRRSEYIIWRSARGSTRFLASTDIPMRFAPSSRRSTSTRGGRIAVGHGTTMSGGALTTRS
jgi:exodeoxyribonuclease-3